MNAFEFLHAPVKRARTQCGLSGTDAAMTEASKLAQDPMLLCSWKTAFCSFLPHQERNVSAQLLEACQTALGH
jgi:hypothetical protein